MISHASLRASLDGVFTQAVEAFGKRGQLLEHDPGALEVSGADRGPESHVGRGFPADLVFLDPT
jgi:hypothetical protein